MKALKLTLSLLVCLTFTGCLSAPSSKPNPLLPWNWGKGDPAAKADRARAEIVAIDFTLLKECQSLFLAAQLELASPKPSIALANSYLRRGASVLAVVAGPVAPDVAIKTEKMVEQMASDDAAEQAKGEKTLAKIDAKVAGLTSDKADQTEKLADAQKQTEVALGRARIAEEKWDRLVFGIWVFVVGYVFFQYILPSLAQEFPAFRILTTAANVVKSITSAHT